MLVALSLVLTMTSGADSLLSLQASESLPLGAAMTPPQQDMGSTGDSRPGVALAIDHRNQPDPSGAVRNQSPPPIQPKIDQTKRNNVKPAVN